MKSTLRKMKREREQDRLEAPLQLAEVQDILHNVAMREHFVKCAKHGHAVKEGDLSLAMGALMISLVYESTQRSGAAINATIQEYNRAKDKMDREDESVVRRVICVREHKPGKHGTAKLVADKEDKEKYLKIIRFLLVEHCSTPCNFLFVLPGGKRVDHPMRLFNSLGAKFGSEPLTSTAARK